MSVLLVILDIDLGVDYLVDILPVILYFLICRLDLLVQLLQATLTCAHTWLQILKVFLVLVQLFLQHVGRFLNYITDAFVLVNGVVVVLLYEGLEFALLLLQSSELFLHRHALVHLLVRIEQYPIKLTVFIFLVVLYFLDLRLHIDLILLDLLRHLLE